MKSPNLMYFCHFCFKLHHSYYRLCNKLLESFFLTSRGCNVVTLHMKTVLSNTSLLSLCPCDTAWYIKHSHSKYNHQIALPVLWSPPTFKSEFHKNSCRLKPFSHCLCTKGGNWLLKAAATLLFAICLLQMLWFKILVSITIKQIIASNKQHLTQVNHYHILSAHRPELRHPHFYFNCLESNKGSVAQPNRWLVIWIFLSHFCLPTVHLNYSMPKQNKPKLKMTAL